MNITENDIAKWLQKTNETIRQNHFSGNPRIKCSPKILAKCEKQKFYLFAGDWRASLKNLLAEL